MKMNIYGIARVTNTHTFYTLLAIVLVLTVLPINSSSVERVTFLQLVTFLQKVISNYSKEFQKQGCPQSLMSDVKVACDAYEHLVARFLSTSMFIDVENKGIRMDLVNQLLANQHLIYNSKSILKDICALLIKIKLVYSKVQSEGVVTSQALFMHNECLSLLEIDLKNALVNGVLEHEELDTFIKITKGICGVDKKLLRDIFNIRLSILKYIKQLRPYLQFISDKTGKNKGMNFKLTNPIILSNEKVLYAITCNKKIVSLLEKELVGIENSRQALCWKFADNIIFCLVTVAVIPIIVVGSVIYAVNYITNALSKAKRVKAA